MAMDKATKYFALCIGPLLIYITISLYLKDEEGHTKIRSGLLESGDRSHDGSRILTQNSVTILNTPEYLLMHKEQRAGRDYVGASESIKEELETGQDVQNEKKSGLFTKLPRRKFKNNFVEDFSFDDLDEYIGPRDDPLIYSEYGDEKDIGQNDIQPKVNSPIQEEYKNERDFVQKPIRPKVDPRIHKDYENKKDFVQKPMQPIADSQIHKTYENEKDFVQDPIDASFLGKIKDPKIDNDEPPSGEKKTPKSSFGVEKEPDTKWCQKTRTRVLILVFTQPERSYERIVARKTWIKNMPNDFTMFFVMGKPDDNIMADIDEELNIFQDLLIGTFKDKNRSTTTKFMMALMWFSQLQNVCKVPRYVLKTADNIYINMEALTYWIKNELPMTKNLYLGRVVRKDEPVRIRNNPRYVPRSAFKDFVFPDYLNGPQYLFSADVMHRMAYVTRLVFPIAVEDAYIGLLCHRLEISPIWDENFHLLMKTTNVCVNAKLLFIFCKSAKEMSKHQKEINNSKRNSQCKPPPVRVNHIGL